MRRPTHIFLFVLIVLLFPLAACSPGHVGSNVIAFIRAGQLWTVDPNGANAFAVAAQDTPVVGYAWSPNHQMVVFRALDPDFAKTRASKQLDVQPLTEQIGDVPSTANTIGVDGGSPITIAFSNIDVLYSNPVWSPSGTRLLYRQTGTPPPATPDNVRWWVSQSDQPGGIAIKTLPASYSIPSISYNTNGYSAIGNSEVGLFTTTLAGTNEHFLQQETLDGHPLPATLERVLWQPAHQNASVLYALPQPLQQGQSLQIQLVQRTLNGQITQLASCACTQFAWSPDGNYVLYSSATAYTLLRLSDHSTFTIQGANGSVPYWSPNSHFLLLDGPHSLLFVNIAQRLQTTLLSDGSAMTPTEAYQLPAANTLLQPVPNSIWAADSRHFIFQTQQRLQWQNQALKGGKGLYTVTIDDSGKALGTPAMVDSGNDSQVGWTYQDPNTTFLY